MAEQEQELKAPVMTSEEQDAYRAELRQELADLEFAQYIHPSDYKAERIKRLQSRLGISVDRPRT